MKVVVGCPVRARAWVMDAWFQAVEDSCGAANVDPVFAFVVDPADKTMPIIERWARHAEVHLVYVTEEPVAELRSWNLPGRLEHMVEVRNLLLDVVRHLSPDLFWSVDSDILVAPGTFASAVEYLQEGRFDAVGSLTWMTPVGMEWPNHGHWDPAHGGLRRFRTDIGVQYPTTVLMAVKLMTPAAYGVDYQLADSGEDVGWSLACRDKGLKFGIDAKHPVKHVMGPKGLEMVDTRIGW